MTQWFDLGGAKLRVVADDDLIAPLSQYLGELACDPAAQADFTLSIEVGREVSPPVKAPLLCRGPLPESGLPCEISALGAERWIVLPGRLSLHVAPEQRLAAMRVRPESKDAIGGSAAIFAIDAVLAAADQWIVHAAALHLPNSGRALMAFAPSGAGKTTLALALALDGFGLLTDDIVVLVRGTGGAREIWGLPRSLRVHRRTGALLPEIGGLLHDRWNADDEQTLSRAVLKSLVRAPKPCPTPLAAICLLGERVRGDHVLKPMSKAEALVRLAGDNLRKEPNGVVAGDARRFEAMASAVTLTPVYELRVGEPLRSVPGLIRRTLDG